MESVNFHTSLIILPRKTYIYWGIKCTSQRIVTNMSKFVLVFSFQKLLLVIYHE